MVVSTFNLEYLVDLSDIFINKVKSQLNTQTIIIGTIIFFSSFKLFSQVRYLTRCCLAILTFSITIILSLPVSLLCFIIGRRKNCNYYLGLIFSKLSELVFQHHYYIIDDQVLHNLTTPAIFICNHQSSLDISYMGKIFPRECSVMAKKSLQFFPLLGLYLRISGAFLVDRKNHTKAIATTTKLAKNMIDSQVSVLMYPEGTRSGLDTPKLLPFKTGAFHLSLETGYPIVPIVFSNTSHLYSKKHWRFESGGMGIKVLEPIDPSQFSKETVHDFIDKVHDKMERCLQEISKIDYTNYHPSS